jgi:hypothetical protein
MNQKLAAAGALATIALLTACGPKAGGASTSVGAPGAGAPASGPDVAIGLTDMPRQRAGLWKNVIDDGDGKPDVETSCASGKISALPKMPAGCSQPRLKRTLLGAYVMDLNCATPKYTMVEHAVLTGDFQTHVSGDMTMTMSINQAPTQTIKTHNDATWLGPCAPGQKPDDEIDSSAPS